MYLLLFHSIVDMGVILGGEYNEDIQRDVFPGICTTHCEDA